MHAFAIRRCRRVWHIASRHGSPRCYLNGRDAVYFSAEDLSVGLVGQNVDGIVGYQPDLATTLMERMILLAQR